VFQIAVFQVPHTPPFNFGALRAPGLHPKQHTMKFFSHTNDHSNVSCVNSGTNLNKNRPLSPHLTIYTPQLTSTLSIFHRISGAFLALSFLTWFAVFQCCNLYLTFYPIYSTIMLTTQYFIYHAYFLFLCLTALSYHLTNGIRHLLWDCGLFLDLSSVYASGIIINIIGCALFTFMVVQLHN
jgi:succinate dehydrogenase / fumarate reductase cytochrome b subunit